MYYLYAVMLYLFVLFLSLFVLKMFSVSTKASNEYIILLINDKTDVKRIKKRIKEIYYEESLAGKNGIRQLIVADSVFREDVSQLCESFESIDYMLVSELDEYFIKKEKRDEQSAVR